MVNEVLQWMAIATISLILLGVLRQIALGTAVPRRPGTLTGIPRGSKVSRRAIELLSGSLGGAPPDEFLVAFVSDGCVGCRQLLSDLEDSTSRFSQPLILVAKSPSQPFKDALAELGHPVLWDDDGELWRAFEVTATPLVVKLSNTGTLLAKEVTHLVDKVAAAA